VSDIKAEVRVKPVSGKNLHGRAARAPAGSNRTSEGSTWRKIGIAREQARCLAVRMSSYQEIEKYRGVFVGVLAMSAPHASYQESRRPVQSFHTCSSLFQEIRRVAHGSGSAQRARNRRRHKWRESLPIELPPGRCRAIRETPHPATQAPAGRSLIIGRGRLPRSCQPSCSRALRSCPAGDVSIWPDWVSWV
jgi:hypothetical protein